MTDEPTEPETSYDQELGQTVQLLMDRGHTEAAALLLDCRIVRIDHVDLLFALPFDDSAPVSLCDVWVEGPTHVTDSIHHRMAGEIVAHLNEAFEAQHVHVREMNFTAPPVPADWRERASRRLGEGPRNQATLAPKPPDFRADRMSFRSAEEVKVYEALRRAQDRRPEAETLTILALPSARITGNTLEPDFVVCFKNRVGVIEVDGPHHVGKRASDTSRDRLFRYCGIAEVDHFDVTDVRDAEALDRLVEGFLWRLGKQP
ncbi:hypothetical protein L2K70_01840 [Nocardioides KLBMP 9356]|uniref:DUF559 domain-containing protein n=1 Tax=Nocardioides potassii TaxID=2911371 RepID=A0ABS9H820_9ACTN|nr:hypothetical protein [Nocardioides potassii]MCF6376340.1 hypothetical protein [Nocardioides potassii]